jgi:hypothetical protein
VASAEKRGKNTKMNLFRRGEEGTGLPRLRSGSRRGEGRRSFRRSPKDVMWEKEQDTEKRGHDRE